MALKVKVGGEVGYLDCGDIVELAAHFDLDPFRRGHVELKVRRCQSRLVQPPSLCSNYLKGSAAFRSPRVLSRCQGFKLGSSGAYFM